MTSSGRQIADSRQQGSLPAPARVPYQNGGWTLRQPSLLSRPLIPCASFGESHLVVSVQVARESLEGAVISARSQIGRVLSWRARVGDGSELSSTGELREVWGDPDEGEIILRFRLLDATVCRAMIPLDEPEPLALPAPARV